MKGALYLANFISKQFVVVDANGHFKRGYDVSKLLELSEKEKDEANIVGFSVAQDGSILFTIPVHFRAYKLSLDGRIQSFGKKGSAPGRFNIVAGIASDDKGYIYIAPNQIEVDGKGRVYVTQSAPRGVSVFKINYE
jgi:hypothetical protein